jgi:hypothetical protein
MVHLYLLLGLVSHLFPNEVELKESIYHLYKFILERKNLKGTWYTPIKIEVFIDESNA